MIPKLLPILNAPWEADSGQPDWIWGTDAHGNRYLMSAPPGVRDLIVLMQNNMVLQLRYDELLRQMVDGADYETVFPTQYQPREQSMSTTIIKPTIGRVVWFHPAANMQTAGFAAPEAGQPLAAIVARVWNDQLVNLSVFDANGVPHSRTSVKLVQDGETPPENGYYCEWMPYQKGQAAKAEQAEKAKIVAADPVLPPHQQRVVQEKQELDDKLSKLDAFIASSPIFLTLDTAEQGRLTRQFRSMESYSDVLAERIAAF